MKYAARLPCWAHLFCFWSRQSQTHILRATMLHSAQKQHFPVLLLPFSSAFLHCAPARAVQVPGALYVRVIRSLRFLCQCTSEQRAAPPRELAAIITFPAKLQYSKLTSTLRQSLVLQLASAGAGLFRFLMLI